MRIRRRGKGCPRAREDRAALEPHRHDDELSPVRPGLANQATRVGVSDAELDLLAIDGRERVEQVIHVEADLHRVAAVLDLERLDGLFLLWIVGLEHDAIGAELEPYASILLVREDRRALQGLAEQIAVRLDHVLWLV